MQKKLCKEQCPLIYFFFFFFSHLNTSGLLCDCNLKWLSRWLIDSLFQQPCTAVCAIPAPLAGRSVFSVPQEGFVCGE